MCMHWLRLQLNMMIVDVLTGHIEPCTTFCAVFTLLAHLLTQARYYAPHALYGNVRLPCTQSAGCNILCPSSLCYASWVPSTSLCQGVFGLLLHADLARRLEVSALLVKI